MRDVIRTKVNRDDDFQLELSVDDFEAAFNKLDAETQKEYAMKSLVIKGQDAVVRPAMAAGKTKKEIIQLLASWDPNEKKERATAKLSTETVDKQAPTMSPEEISALIASLQKYL